MAAKKTAQKKATLPPEEKEKAADEKARAEAAKKADPKYQGDTKNTAPYMESYS